MSRVSTAFVAALAVIGVAIAVTLLRHPTTVERKNGVLVHSEVVSTVDRGTTTLCQAHEAIPRGTKAIEPGLSANTGPAIHVTVTAGGRALTSGQLPAGWNGRVVAVPVAPLANDVADATVCVNFAVSDETIGIHGAQSPRATGVVDNREALPERMWINYLGPSKQRWISQLHGVARRMELGRTTTGFWVVLLALALPAGAIALASRLALRSLHEQA
jgi:hypothetical protein